MSSEDTAIKHYYSLNPTDFHDLERFEIRQTNVSGAVSVVLQIELRAKESADFRRLVLSFRGVRDLTFVPPELSILCFWFLEIVPIADNQWEGINYRVFETEQDAELSFVCQDFEAEVVSPSDLVIV